MPKRKSVAFALALLAAAAPASFAQTASRNGVVTTVPGVAATPPSAPFVPGGIGSSSTFGTGALGTPAGVGNGALGAPAGVDNGTNTFGTANSFGTAPGASAGASAVTTPNSSGVLGAAPNSRGVIGATPATPGVVTGNSPFPCVIGSATNPC